jgi:WD40 repeat protein
VLAGGGIATGSLIATGGGDNAINIVQVVQDDAGVNMLQRVQTVPEAHEGDINCVRWGPCELSSAEDADLFVSRLAGGAALPDDTRAYLPASNILASAADDGTVRLWTFVSVDNGGP